MLCIRRFVFLLPGALCLIARPASAHDDKESIPARPVAAADEHRPSPIPDRILLSLSGDPATSISVTWRTDESVAQAVAEISPAGPGPDFKDQRQRLNALTTRLLTDLGPACFHEAAFTDLQPVTRYAYRVGDGTNWSEWNHFVTAADEAAPFSFVYFGDAQNDIKSQWSRVIREAYADAPQAAFLLHAGDLINHAHSDAEWGEWFSAASHIHRMIPCVATPGNHEYDYVVGDGIISLDKRLSTHWNAMFAFPKNGPAGLEETVYWLDYQGTRIVSLNSNRRSDEQTAWLDRILSENPQRWTIVTFHHPIFSAKESRDNPHLRGAWQPVFDKHKVDLVLQGHDHAYARTGLMVHDENVPTGVTARSELGGTVYVVSVSGPKMYEVARGEHMRRVAENTQLYQIIHVSSDELKYEARTAVGDLYDGFRLKKRDGGINELIEQVPDVPERTGLLKKDAG